MFAILRQFLGANLVKLQEHVKLAKLVVQLTQWLRIQLMGQIMLESYFLKAIITYYRCECPTGYYKNKDGNCSVYTTATIEALT